MIGTKTRIETELGENCYAITEDGSCGLKGMLNDHLEDIIKEVQPEKIFICGPNPAMKYAAGIAQKHNIDIEVALERVFACGTGVCMGCVIQVLENGEQVQKRVCKDGPVFNGASIIWE